jgi:hypothetical protein
LKYLKSAFQASASQLRPVSQQIAFETISLTTSGSVLLSVDQYPVEPFQEVAFGSYAQTTRPGWIPLATPIGVLHGSAGVNVPPTAGLLLVIEPDNQRVNTAAAKHIAATTYRDLRKSLFVLRSRATEPARPNSHTTKPDASGAATRWQGYTARLGLGMTRTINHKSAKRPVIGNSHLTHLCFFAGFSDLPVFGQTDCWFVGV